MAAPGDHRQLSPIKEVRKGRFIEMTRKEREQLEALEMYLLHAGQRASRNMEEAETLAKSLFYKGILGAYQEAYYLVHDFLDHRLELPE